MGGEINMKKIRGIIVFLLIGFLFCSNISMAICIKSNYQLNNHYLERKKFNNVESGGNQLIEEENSISKKETRMINKLSKCDFDIYNTFQKTRKKRLSIHNREIPNGCVLYGESDTNWTTANIYHEPLGADIIGPSSINVKVGEIVTFKGEAWGGYPPYYYRWNFDSLLKDEFDTPWSEDNTITWSWNTVGWHEVQLAVKDSKSGREVYAYQDVTVPRFFSHNIIRNFMNALENYPILRQLRLLLFQ